MEEQKCVCATRVDCSHKEDTVGNWALKREVGYKFYLVS